MTTKKNYRFSELSERAKIYAALEYVAGWSETHGEDWNADEVIAILYEDNDQFTEEGEFIDKYSDEWIEEGET